MLTQYQTPFSRLFRNFIPHSYQKASRRGARFAHRMSTGHQIIPDSSSLIIGLAQGRSVRSPNVHWTFAPFGVRELIPHPSLLSIGLARGARFAHRMSTGHSPQGVCELTQIQPSISQPIALQLVPYGDNVKTIMKQERPQDQLIAGLSSGTQLPGSNH